MSPKTALITGACSGIGFAIARGLAMRGYDLVLISNREGPLTDAAHTLSQATGRTVLPLCQDLAQLGSAQSVYEQVKARGLAIDILVNNAGFFFFGEVADAEPAQAERLLTLHVTTPSVLCTYFGRDMRSRRCGRILMVSSISAFRDFPGIAYYGSSKKYLRGFSAALRSELSVYGIVVTCVLPGATATALYDSSNIPVEFARKVGIMAAPDFVAEQALSALFSGRAECIPGVANILLTQLAKNTPQKAIELLRKHAPWLPRSVLQ